MARLRIRPPGPDQRGLPGRWGPGLAMALMGFLAWWLAVPSDWSEGEPWGPMVGACLIGGILSWIATRTRPELAAPAAIGTTAGLVVGAIVGSLRAEGDDLVPWPFVVLGVVGPTALLLCFGGAWVALRSAGMLGRRRYDDEDDPTGGPDTPT